ncbi:MAG: phosphate signaling complex protein PhoU [Syntrophorhabdales bacterium]|jgi:phosphate transport system protein
MLDEKMVDLKRELTEYSTLVQGMIERSIEGLLKKQRLGLLDIIEKDEPRANEWEITLDELCIYTIAQFAPRAKDLRTILMALRINNDLERMGDHAVNIAEDALFLIERPQVKPLIDIPRMAEEATHMVRDSLFSFFHEDSALAKSVCERDSIVDRYAEQSLRELITYMSADPTIVERASRLLNIARNLERIADLSTNIAEDVIFMVEGQLIKHHHVEHE